jgi:phosphatidylglycerophosphatase A
MAKIYEFISTGFYVGYFSKAPGTFGSLTAALIAWNLRQFTQISWIGLAVAAFVSFFVGLYCVSKLLQDTKEKDPGYVVIDEWAGQFLTFCFAPLTFETLVVGFVLFRIFDISKIYPINKTEKLKGAVGVMVDDMVAGLYAGTCLYVWHLLRVQAGA